jgi:trans-2,3-dihydro-3-hydroxyanthranilate isomerase
MTAHPYVIADVFTDRPLEGNGLAVFTDASALPEQLLQPLARELNLSETVFALPAEQGGDARIRIFTPGRELPFAGHPVLGSAVVLAAGADAITLETGLGPVTVELSPTDTAAVFGRMTQPHPTLEPFADAPAVLAALALERSEIPLTELYVNGPRNAYVALRSEDAVAALAPDMQALRAIGPVNVSCFALTGMRVKTRVFGPGLGVPEDPATGSAAGPLALHLARHGAIEWGQEIEISQGAEINRPSRLYARVTGSADAVERIEVAGAAVVVARGEFEF